MMASGRTHQGTAVRLDLAYDGTAFSGWAKQPGRRTVQGEVERALGIFLRHPVIVRVAGRTDAGVHAAGQVASFVTGARVVPERLRLGLNALLPEDVAVSAVTCVPEGFDARAAVARTYRYRLWLAPERPALERHFVWHVHGRVDTEVLVASAAVFTGRRDWRALTPSAHLYRDCTREVLAATWRPAAVIEGCGEEWVFEVTARSFLHMMVRVMVGSMVEVALGRLTLDDIAAALACGERRRMGRTAPARGLMLMRVAYGG